MSSDNQPVIESGTSLLGIDKHFDKISPTTMAVNYVLNNSINICKLFPLLRIYGESAKPGQIKSATYENILPWAGAEKVNNRYMKNTIMINIITEDKELNIKLFKDKMHSCGFKNEKIGLRGAQTLVNIINSIICELDYIQSNPEEYQKLVCWLKDRCFIDGFDVPVLIVPKETPPPEISTRMWNFVIPHIQYYQPYAKNYDTYMAHLRWLATCKIVSEGPKHLEIINNIITMMNFNHELNFSLQKVKLAMIFKENPEFRVRYDNMIDHSVTISLPYEIINEKKSKEHTFSVHHEGHVNQSSPNRELAKIAYEKFINYILKYKDDIIIQEKQVDIYYVPVNNTNN